MTLFDATHDLFRQSWKAFVAKEISPHVAEWNDARLTPRGLFAAAGAHGFVGMAIPEAYGGGGTDDFRFNMIIAEELAYAGTGGCALGLTLHNDITTPYFLAYCDEAQKARWLPGIAAGELITAVAMTEPGIGSDLASMSTTAIRDGDTYVLNGAKTFITNGINSDLVIVAAKSDPTQKHRGVSLFVVERGMPGFERGRKLDKIGMPSQDTAELFFTDVRVPVANRLGEEGEGFAYLTANLAQERLSIAVTGVAVARQALAWTLDYVKEREPSASRSGRSRTPSSCSPRWPPRSRSPRPSSTTASASCSSGDSPRPGRRWPSGGPPRCRSGPSTAACSCSAATATCSSTPSPRHTPMPG